MKELMPLARTSEIVVLEIKNETLVYDLRVTQAHCLNESAAFVWNHCDGQTTINEISKLIESHYHTSIDEDFVWLALEQLQDKDLLTDGVVKQVQPTSRREMIKKIGLASVVAAPIIASIVAPTHASAAGSCGCSNPGDCFVETTCPSTVNCNGSNLCAP